MLRNLVKIFWLPGAFFLLDEMFLYATNSYDRLPWLDIPTHFIGGALIAYSAFVFFGMLEARRAAHFRSRFVKILFIVSLVALIAVFWEWHEFLRDILFGEHTQPSLADTMGDFFMGLLGGFVSALFVTRR